ncbi:MAG: PDZ domain-containing protein [Candidatus Obscuribacterales bacterium]|nr:PDZ domain-containing protein [Candidatus Obscuribacterales bacterium]
MTLGIVEAVKAQPVPTGSSMNAAIKGGPKGALGLVINWNPQVGLVVTQIVAGGPAALAGVAVGDQLLSIDGASVQGLPVDQIFQRILGAAGTTSVLGLSSPSRGNYEARMTRVTVDALKQAGSFNVGWQPANASPANANASGAPTGNSGNIDNSNGTIAGAFVDSASTNSAASGVAWNTYGGAEEGFSLNYPQGWSVKQDSKTGKIEIAGKAGCNLSIFPFFLPSKSMNVNEAQGLFTAMLKQYAKGPQWSAPSSVGGALRATSTSNNVASIAGLAISSTSGGTAGQLIVFTTPNNPNAQSELGFLPQILKSFSITGGALPNNGDASGSSSDSASAPASVNSGPFQNVQYTTFTDPKLGSFSLQVPVGWNVTGGMERPMSVDLRPWVKAVSPDEKIMVFIGDASIESRYLPSRILSWTGFGPGSNYSPGSGLQTKVLYYQKADKFIDEYAKKRLASKCDSFELVNVEHHPDLARSINGTAGVVAADAASAKYNFTTKGNQCVAYFLASTKKGKEMWWVSLNSGVAADQAYEEQALNIFMTMLKSWQFNPQWSEAQGKENVRFGQAAIANDIAIRAQLTRSFNARMAAMDQRHSAYMSKMRASDAAHASYMNRMHSSDRSHSDFINYIRDEDTLVNPSTGTQYQVEYGPKYHWVNSTGTTTLGTDSAWSPGVDWTELVTPPR